MSHNVPIKIITQKRKLFKEMSATILLLVLLGCSCVVGQSGGISEGDPAPGRSPGPPSTSPGYETIPTLLLVTQETTANAENNQVGDGTPGDLAEGCPRLLLAGDDLIVVDKEKAAVVVNVSHELFSTDVLTTGLTYNGKFIV